jgi:hypothetical protein
MNLHKAAYRSQPSIEIASRPYVHENVLGAGLNRSRRRRSPLRWFGTITFLLAASGLLVELLSC